MRIKIARLVSIKKNFGPHSTKGHHAEKMSPCEAQNKATFGNVLIINLVIIIKMTARGP